MKSPQDKEYQTKTKKIKQILTSSELETARSRGAEWREKNREKARAQQRERTRRYNLKHKRKRYATNIVNIAVRRGHLTPQPCAICKKFPAEAHHSDYRRALDVTWLCKAHHESWHRLFIAEGL